MASFRLNKRDLTFTFETFQREVTRRRMELKEKNKAFFKQIGIRDQFNYMKDEFIDFSRLDGFLKVFVFQSQDKEHVEEVKSAERDYKIQYKKLHDELARAIALKDMFFQQSQKKDGPLDRDAGPTVCVINNAHKSEDGNPVHKIIYD